MSFAPPREEERRRAIGPTLNLSPALRRAFAAAGGFEPIPAPGPHDWLANHHEPGQTFETFLRSRSNRPDAARRSIYLQPLDEFAPGSSPSLEALKVFAKAFFAMEVQIVPIVRVEGASIQTRTHPATGQRQLLTPDILMLLAKKLPRDAYCVVGITVHDLYPDRPIRKLFRVPRTACVPKQEESVLVD